jgi:mono/diheme cytochrome c family protein
MRVILLLTTALLAVAQVDQEDHLEETRSVQSGVYTEAQAERGASVFKGTCVSCHQPGEFGDGAYMDGWSGQTAHDLIELIRATMPQDNPGSLKRKEYVDVVAYLFRLNGLPAGDAEMDVSSVKWIRIEGPYRPGLDLFSR